MPWALLVGAGRGRGWDGFFFRIRFALLRLLSPQDHLMHNMVQPALERNGIPWQACAASVPHHKATIGLEAIVLELLSEILRAACARVKSMREFQVEIFCFTFRTNLRGRLRRPGHRHRRGEGVLRTLPPVGSTAESNVRAEIGEERPPRSRRSPGGSGCCYRAEAIGGSGHSYSASY